MLCMGTHCPDAPRPFPWFTLIPMLRMKTSNF